MSISICYITARDEPRLDWLLEGLEQQARPADCFDLIVIDALGRSAESLNFRTTERVSRLIVTRPKPTIWQGPHKVTKHDFFANANARNTGLVLCNTPYIVFLDDRCKLDPSWVRAACSVEGRNAVVCGPYDKHEDDRFTPDHRRQHAPQGKDPSYASWCFGGNLVLPLEWALDVNGFEEGCDPVGGEDFIFGNMLENSGRRLIFDIAMSVQQDRRGFLHPPGFPRHDKGHAPNNKVRALIERFSKRKRTEFTPDLRDLRARLQKGEAFPIPDPASIHRDWFDGEQINSFGLSEKDRALEALGNLEERQVRGRG